MQDNAKPTEPAKSPAGSKDEGATHTVDVPVQEEAAKERKDEGGYQ